MGIKAKELSGGKNEIFNKKINWGFYVITIELKTFIMKHKIHLTDTYCILHFAHFVLKK